MFRAARFGVAAELPDPDGRLRSVPEQLAAALDDASGYAALEELPALLRRGGGAGRQRAAREIGGMGALLRQLTELTGSGTAVRAAHREHA